MNTELMNETIKNYSYEHHLELIHKARIHLATYFLPKAKDGIVLDLGGANCPLYRMGFPTDFNCLYLIDLPPSERHSMYKDIVVDDAGCEGKVVIRYNDMTNLNDFENDSVDLVWSGQSIEHVTTQGAINMCKSAYRVLKKGGRFCLDTPNRLLTFIHTERTGLYIHPEHKYEYTPAELRKMLIFSGFEIVEELGLCEMSSTVNTGVFDYVDFLLGKKITRNIDDSYIQYFSCRK